MRRFHDLPIRHKLTFINVLTSTVALLLACGAIAGYERITFKDDLVRDVASVAEIIAYNSASALSFNDADSAVQTLQALGAKPHIVAACIYDRDGRVFATYPHGHAAADFPPPPAGATESFGAGRLDLFRPIAVPGEKAGTIYLRTDLGRMRERLQSYVLIIGSVMLVAIFVAYLIAWRLQRVISQPVSDLAAIAGRVTTEKDYSIRAAKRGDDELGRLMDGFNEMLDQIQARDNALRSAYDSLEQGTAKLAEASGLLEAMLANSLDWIYFKDRESRFVRFSNSFLQRLSLTDPAMLRGKTDADFYAAAHAQPARADEEEILRTGQPIVGKLEKEIYADGHSTWALTTKMAWRDGTGAIVGTFGISTDVTARKEAEDKLSYERDQWRALLDSSPDTIYFKDTQSRFVLASRSKVQKTLQHVPELRTLRADRGLPMDVPELELLTGLTDLDTYQDDDARFAYEEEQQILRTGLPMIGRLSRQSLRDGTVSWWWASKMPWRDRQGNLIGTFGISKDVTNIKEAEEKLQRVNQQLIVTSRQAGMAEVATSVLHNVGNVLNSVNVSATLIAEQVRHTKGLNIAKLAGLLDQHKADLAGFMTTDARGQTIPAYLGTLAEMLAAEQKTLIAELEHLCKNIQHIKDIVAMQQAYARTSGITETIPVTDLIEDALHMNAGSLVRHDVATIRDYQSSPAISTDKHKVMQILINLLRNAKYACDESSRTDKQITVRTTSDDLGVKIAVIDNGIGIPAENLTRIFNYGFTTRKAGHGFGLHSGALAARELGGSLHVQSDGPGRGATFILELPYKPATL